jgi:hypothetical protein
MKKIKLTQVQRIARLEKVCSANAFDLMFIKKFMKALQDNPAFKEITSTDEEE